MSTVYFIAAVNCSVVAWSLSLSFFIFLGPFGDIPLVLLLNICHWNYYVPSRDYIRDPPFNHLDSAYSESAFSCVLAHNFHFYSRFEGKENRTSGKALRAHERASIPNITAPDTPLPRLLLIPCQVKRNPNIFASPHANGRRRMGTTGRVTMSTSTGSTTNIRRRRRVRWRRQIQRQIGLLLRWYL